MKSSTLGFKKETCEKCGQNTTYLLPLDKGTSIIVKAVAAAIRNKGINRIHPTKEMEIPGSSWTYERAIHEGVLNSIQIGNFTRARVHGLIARVKEESGNWCLTSKGAKFLRGEAVPQFAIVRKTRDDEGSHKEDYFEPEKFTITVNELSNKDETWMGIDFEIREGRIVEDISIIKHIHSGLHDINENGVLTPEILNDGMKSILETKGEEKIQTLL